MPAKAASTTALEACTPVVDTGSSIETGSMVTRAVVVVMMMMIMKTQGQNIVA